MNTIKTKCQGCNNPNHNLIELLEVINEKLGALIYQLNPPVVRELNTPSGYQVLSITTTTGEVYNHPQDVTGDTWTGTVTFKSKSSMREGLYTVLDGNQIQSLLIKPEPGEI